MPKGPSRERYARRLHAARREGARYVDLCVEFVDERDNASLLKLGGRWDRKHKGWSDEEPKSQVQFRCHPGQIPTVEFFAGWMEAYLAGVDLEPPIYSCLLKGGSRAGKTKVGLWMMVAFTIAVPDARVWAVQEAKTDDVDELEQELVELLPNAWFEVSGSRYKCANGSTITIRSAMHAAKLKRGRCDFAFLNEGQNVEESAHNMLRMRTSDTSGLVVTAANPPNNNPKGEWVADFFEDVQAGLRENSVAFHFDPRENPHVNREQLESLKAETDLRTYEIEVLGQVKPPSDAVLHAFRAVNNVDTVPELPGMDVTEQFAYHCRMGKQVRDFVGVDFQRKPHVVGIAQRAYLNPLDDKRPLLYARQELLVEMGDEHDLSDMLYSAGYDPQHTALICDASGAYQDIDRVKNNNSFDILQDLGWTRIFKPDATMEANPPLSERMLNDNRLLCSAEEIAQHIARVDPCCEHLIECLKKYRAKHGRPDRHSRYAHIWDAWSYTLWRLMPRRSMSSRVKYKSVSKRRRPRSFRGVR